jgi:hypothetical protein
MERRDLVDLTWLAVVPVVLVGVAAGPLWRRVAGGPPRVVRFQ